MIPAAQPCNVKGRLGWRKQRCPACCPARRCWQMPSCNRSPAWPHPVPAPAHQLLHCRGHKRCGHQLAEQPHPHARSGAGGRGNGRKLAAVVPAIKPDRHAAGGQALGLCLLEVADEPLGSLLHRHRIHSVVACSGSTWEPQHCASTGGRSTTAGEGRGCHPACPPPAHLRPCGHGALPCQTASACRAAPPAQPRLRLPPAAQSPAVSQGWHPAAASRQPVAADGAAKPPTAARGGRRRSVACCCAPLVLQGGLQAMIAALSTNRGPRRCPSVESGPLPERSVAGWLAATASSTAAVATMTGGNFARRNVLWHCRRCGRHRPSRPPRDAVSLSGAHPSNVHST